VHGFGADGAAVRVHHADEFAASVGEVARDGGEVSDVIDGGVWEGFPCRRVGRELGSEELIASRAYDVEEGIVRGEGAPGALDEEDSGLLFLG